MIYSHIVNTPGGGGAPHRHIDNHLITLKKKKKKKLGRNGCHCIMLYFLWENKA
jgi:hypothetical protein